MAPKQAPVYSRKGKLKFVSPSKHLINESSEDEYVSKTTRDSPIVLVTMRNITRQSEEGLYAKESQSGSESYFGSSSDGTSTSASDATSIRDAQDPLGVKVQSVHTTTKPNR
ncbi:hypothetical protein KY290_027698 [Solanum tuberosum]|uniref:Integrase core domain containing protein n=1 Tax=Solanum tuberosum TaxID=4113 RepID=A0ABQ7UFR7_SOLTU|nr:hypothetical protein KY290_027698 [Solanum tuberosum]